MVCRIGRSGTSPPYSGSMMATLQKLRRIYLSTHALSWAAVESELPRMPESDRERKAGMGEHWPGRAEACLQLDSRLRQNHFELIRNAKSDEGFFVLESNPELVQFAREHFGPRCVVCRLENNLEQNCQVLGPQFARGLDEDRRLAVKNRGCEVTDVEFSAWGRSKAWTIDLTEQLHEQGYTFDPAEVEFLALGENWVGCGATFPIHMGRAFGLAHPIERRFDWMNPDWSPMLMGSEVVEQNLPMPEHIRLFIFKTAVCGPTYGRYIAQFWEGMRSIVDRPHTVLVRFPPESVMECDITGWPVCRSRGLIEYPQHHFHGEMAMHVGLGAHTAHYSTVAMADHKLSLEEFRAALLAGEVVAKNEGDGPRGI